MVGCNEHPDRPCPATIRAITQIAPQGGRYLRDVQLEPMTTPAAELRLPLDHLMAHAGSTEPLDYTMLAFASPGASLATADPIYESGWRAATRNGAKLIKVPLRKDFSHDVQAMCSADAHAGVIYICNPNNPTGSATARKDLDYALAHKPKGSVLMVDEAYIHFAQNTRSRVDMVAAGRRRGGAAHLLQALRHGRHPPGLRRGTAGVVGQADVLQRQQPAGNGGRSRAGQPARHCTGAAMARPHRRSTRGCDRVAARAGLRLHRYRRAIASWSM